MESEADGAQPRRIEMTTSPGTSASVSAEASLQKAPGPPRNAIRAVIGGRRRSRYPGRETETAPHC